MMYNNKLVLAVKANGKVLRELKDTVYIPFGTEYSLLVKNLDSVRAQVRISVDGTDATEGVSLIVPANGELELERFIKNGNMKEGNRFKFIERTAGIEQHRGVGVTDGLIRVEFQFEKRVPVYIEPLVYRPYRPYWTYNDGPLYFAQQNLVQSAFASDEKMYSPANITCSTATASSVSTTAHNALRSRNVNNLDIEQMSTATSTINDVGITVPGSKSEQEFKQALAFAVESEVHVMVLKMLGETVSGKAVTQAVTVKQKPKCTTCGRTNKATAKFCIECGTSLEIV